MNQRLISFDVRLNKDGYVMAFWDDEHRKRFLLQSDIEWPLSIDPLVWPSVFFTKIFRDSTKLPYGSIEVDPITDGGEYWLSLEAMKAHYEAHKSPSTNGVFICVQLFSEQQLSGNIVPYVDGKDIQCGLPMGHTIPSNPPFGSEILGYDVADASRISGLMNCEYTINEKQRLAPIWKSRLNAFGLLDTLPDAVEFRDVCNARIPEHSPFWVYGISQLPIGLSIKSANRFRSEFDKEA